MPALSPGLGAFTIVSGVVPVTHVDVFDRGDIAGVVTAAKAALLHRRGAVGEAFSAVNQTRFRGTAVFGTRPFPVLLVDTTRRSIEVLRRQGLVKHLVLPTLLLIRHVHHFFQKRTRTNPV